MNCNSSRSTLQKQFINHCVVLIQSSFKAYQQRKRYRQFLPVYRRIRELLMATFQGWKIRKIMKLQPIKAQINLIKENTKNNQLSKIRICKRQLIDQIQRLRKRGKWVQIYKKNRPVKYLKASIESKENCPLYGNIKAVKIKNIFKKDKEAGRVVSRQEKQSKNQSAQVKKKENKKQKNEGEIGYKDKEQLEENQQCVPTERVTSLAVANCIEQQIILPKKEFFSNLEDQLALSLTEKGKDQKNKKILRKSSKYSQHIPRIPQKNICKQQIQFQTSTSTKIKLQEQHISSSLKKINTETKSKANHQRELISSNYKASISNSRFTETNHSGSKKLKLSLVRKVMVNASQLSAHQSIVKQTKEDLYNCENLLKSSSKEKMKKKVNTKQNTIYSLLLTYRSTYMQKKAQIIRKLRQIDSKFASELKKDYINKTNSFDS